VEWDLFRSSTPQNLKLQTGIDHPASVLFGVGRVNTSRDRAGCLQVPTTESCQIPGTPQSCFRQRVPMRAGPISSNYPVIHVVSMWRGGRGVGSRLFVNLLAPVSG